MRTSTERKLLAAFACGVLALMGCAKSSTALEPELAAASTSPW
jgi:hypothetical protein